MNQKIKTQKGFIQIPLLVIVIASIVVASVGAGVVLHTQGKLAPLVANISEVFKETDEIIITEEKEIKPEELQVEQKPEVVQEETGQPEVNQKEISQQELEQARLEAEKAKQEIEKTRLEAEAAKGRAEAEKARAEAERLKKEAEEARRKAEAERVAQEEARIRAEQELQRQLEAERLAEEQRQREIARQQELKRQRQVEEQKQNVTPEMGTEVKGIISEDVVWTIENSPYIITDDVLIEKGITLRIEPGVIVKFQKGLGKTNMGGFAILNKGSIIARGVPDNKIIFTSLKSDPQLGDWGTIATMNGGSIDFDYVEIKYASSGVVLQNTSGAIIINSHIRNCGTGIFVNKGPAIISNNLIEENYAGISFMHIPYSGPFDDGTFRYQGIRETKITYNTIRNNKGQKSNTYHVGVRIELNAFLYSLIISHNNIYNNNGAFFFRETGGFNASRHKLPTIKQNNIYDNKFVYNNKEYAVFLAGESEIEINMSNNWWGTTNVGVIDSLIYDYYDSWRPGIITYQPIATSEIPNAGAQ